MAALELDRCFSISAFLAFVELRSYQTLHPDIDISEAIVNVRKFKAGAAGLDFHGAVVLNEALDESIVWDTSKSNLRLFVYEWVRIVQPVWLRYVPYGRERLRSELGENEVQCIREAGLFDEIPDDDAIEWWDRVAALMRGAADIKKMERVRLAERLSLEHERERLKSLGIVREPQWVSLEDNTLGYDILSYDLAAGHIVSRLIEVKSTLSDTVYLTCNEWKNARSAPARTFFHVWKLPEKKFQEIPVAGMEPHIPQDCGQGHWQNVAVTLSA